MKNSYKNSHTGYIVPLLTILLFTVLVGVSFFSFMYRSQEQTGLIMADDIAHLVEVIQKIDKDCRIIDFDYQQNTINFLNIKKDGFVGSEVGSVNLSYPKKWNGPYMNDNPTMQEKEYMIVRTKDGHFITPGNGVILPNQKEIGKDIILDEKADIPAMMNNPELLNYKGRALAGKVTIGLTTMQRVILENIDRV